MKILKWAIALAIGILIGFLLAAPAKAQAPTQQIQNDYLPDIINPYPTVPDSVIQPTTRPPQPSRRNISTRGRVSYQAVYAYLEGSPLQPYSQLIADSEYGGTILGICTIEQYHCQKAPGNNYWGIGGSTGLKKYATPQQGIDAISTLLQSYEDRGYDTIEELNGYYVQPASDCWYNTVLKIKTQLETLTN